MERLISKHNWSKSRLIFASTFACWLNMAFQERLLRSLPDSSNMISFIQHLFIVSVSLFRFGGFIKPKIPIRSYLPLVALNLSMILTNSWSYSFGVSVPLNMIFKSSSLVANMFLGRLILSHRYSYKKYCSVALITGGLLTCTFEDYRLKFTNENDSLTVMDKNLYGQMPGIFLLVASLFLSAGTGIYQEYIRKEYGKHPDESLFYVHLLSLPFFSIITYTSLKYHAELFYEIAYLWFWPNDTTLEQIDTSLIIHLIMVILTQYGCIRYVYKLTTECRSLTVTLVVTNRKFLSILFSILYFGNPFTLYHWLGTCTVFIGTLLFSLG